MSISAAQCRAARALLAWSQDQLSTASSVAKATIANFETGKRMPYDRTLADIRITLERAGIVFQAPGEQTDGGEGVRMLAKVPSIDTNDREMIQYPEFKDGDGGPGSGG